MFYGSLARTKCFLMTVLYYPQRLADLIVFILELNSERKLGRVGSGRDFPLLSDPDPFFSEGRIRIRQNL